MFVIKSTISIVEDRPLYWNTDVAGYVFAGSTLGYDTFFLAAAAENHIYLNNLDNAEVVAID